MSTEASTREKLWSLIKKYRFAMLTTRHAGEQLRSRPMTTIDRDYDGTLWFFAAADSIVAADLRAHPQICLSYADSGNFDFVSVAGDADVVSDVAKKRDLWKPSVQAWFPEGAESEHVVLLKVVPDHAEYWDSKSNRLVQLFTMAKALATGAPPRDIGEHREVDIPAPRAAKS
jgi:general stress protein 26